MGRAWWRSPWLPSGAVVVPVVLTLWAGSVPGGYWTTGLAALACWTVVVLWWAVLAVLALRGRNPVRPWAFLVVPVVLAATAVFAGSTVAERAAFTAHRSSLDALAAETRASADGRVLDRPFALFTISSAVRYADCVLMTVADAGFLDSTGYAHCPDRVPASTVAGGEGYSFHHLDGPWYEFALVW
ncbi:hypothetical protein AB0I60_20865 [Actinosynnema sp. NPDC050436]|uniref:hypothetical protein n=1 Tax=Actinosynnema sp. NPDC050436 TaxID=3155659 RepID=UPI0033DBACBA